MSEVKPKNGEIHWAPVSEPPKVDCFCLLFLQDKKGHYEIDTGAFYVDSDIGWFCSDGVDRRDITHWASLEDLITK